MGENGKSYKKKAWTNSIELDYMANLGLLMAPKEQFNLMSKDHKDDFWYYPINKLLQNALIVMVFLFSLTAFTQRNKLEPLMEVLPKKNDEIMLLELSKIIFTHLNIEMTALIFINNSSKTIKLFLKT